MSPTKTIVAAVLAALISTTPGQALEAVAPKRFGQIDVERAIAALPETSDRALQEVRMIDNGTVGIRVFRIYSRVVRHQHQYSDTYLHILSGKAEFQIEDDAPFEAGAGELLFWQKGTDHQVLRIIEGPLIVYAVDTPTRRPGDILRAQ